MNIKNLVAVVTGGASGLGKASATMLAAQGAKVAVFDLNEESGRATAAEIGGTFVSVIVADDASVTSGLDAVKRAHGVARILVNCAGIAPAVKTLGKENKPHPLDVYRRTIEVNLIGTFNVISKFAADAAAAGEIDGERGVIVNTASVAAYDGQMGQSAYSASKAGIVGMTLPIARGIFLTPMVEAFPQTVQDALGAQVPHPSRLGKPAEYAQLVESIIRNPMLNGEVIRLDGAIRMAPR